jgi:methylmalonyl-CoA mutase
MLRTTVACFGAGVGGANVITVLPFDGVIGRPNDFSHRIARNTQAVLLDESRLAAVIDPVGGSWYVESLTDSLARVAWDEFTEIERAGGIESSLDSGALAGRLEKTWTARAKRIATRKDALTGISEFPDSAEVTIEREPYFIKEEMSTVDSGGGLPRRRYAQDYELLRDRSDAHLVAHGERPKIFLATLGSVADYTARASFAENLFLTGGIGSVSAGVTKNAKDIVAAYKESGCQVACLCGNDASYQKMAVEIVAALTEAGAKSVLIAGRPKGDVAAHLSGSIFAGCDVLEVLEDIMETLGVQ